MEVWFSIVPGHGHFFPLVPLADALRSAGHAVAFCTSGAYRGTIERYGFEVIPVGPDYTQIGAKGEASSPEEVDRVVAQQMFVTAPPLVLEDLLSTLAARRPDVMMLDPWERAGPIAAESAGVPHGSVINGVRTGSMLGRLPLDLPQREEAYEKAVAAPDRRLREIAGLPPHDRWRGEAFYDRTLALDMAPRSLQPWPSRWLSHASHPLRPQAHSSPEEGAAEVDLEGELVVVSFGTLFGDVDLYEKASVAALGTGASVVAATSLPLTVEHDRFRRLPWVSMDRLLERAAVLVHHGGWGSTVAALATGTPAVMVPLGSDQFVNASRVSSCGAGLTVSRAEVETELEPAIAAALRRDVYRLNAERLRDEIADMPAASEVVPLIERFAGGEPVSASL